MTRCGHCGCENVDCFNYCRHCGQPKITIPEPPKHSFDFGTFMVIVLIIVLAVALYFLGYYSSQHKVFNKLFYGVAMGISAVTCQDIKNNWPMLLFLIPMFIGKYFGN